MPWCSMVGMKPSSVDSWPPCWVADEVMADEENRRRHEALSRLKAAVVATEADRADLDYEAPKADANLDPYRGDLAEAILPETPAEPAPAPDVKPRRKSMLTIGDIQGTVRPARHVQGLAQPPVPGPRDPLDQDLACRRLDRALIAGIDLQVADRPIFQARPLAALRRHLHRAAHAVSSSAAGAAAAR